MSELIIKIDVEKTTTGEIQKIVRSLNALIADEVEQPKAYTPVKLKEAEKQEEPKTEKPKKKPASKKTAKKVEPEESKPEKEPAKEEESSDEGGKSEKELEAQFNVIRGLVKELAVDHKKEVTKILMATGASSMSDLSKSHPDKFDQFQKDLEDFKKNL